MSNKKDTIKFGDQWYLVRSYELNKKLYLQCRTKRRFCQMDRYSELIHKEKMYGLTDEEYEELQELEFESQREDEMRMAWQEVQEGFE